MKEKPKTYLASINGSYLVSGSIGTWKFDGNGKAFEFNAKDAELLRDEFGYAIEEVTEDQNN